MKTSAELQLIIPLLPTDPDLNVIAPFVALLVTQGHIVVRFAQYAEYPVRLWKMCRDFNPDGYCVAIEEFLMTGDNSLDCGYLPPLKQEAWQDRSLADAVAFLMSPALQEEL